MRLILLDHATPFGTDQVSCLFAPMPDTSNQSAKLAKNHGTTMNKKTAKAFRPVYPTPAAMITSISEDGVPNIITLGEVFNVGLANPPISGIAIRKATYSHGLISQTREFGINLPTSKLLYQTDLCGGVSGRDMNKFTEAGLRAIPSRRIKPPLIDECPVNLECRVLSIQEVGDHDLFLGEVLEIHVDESVLDNSGQIDYARLDVLCFLYNLGGKAEYWSIGKKLSDAFLTRK